MAIASASVMIGIVSGVSVARDRYIWRIIAVITPFMGPRKGRGAILPFP